MSVTKLTGGHTSEVLCVDVQADTGKVISGGEGGQLCLWSPEGQLINKLTRPSADCTSVLFSKLNPNIFYAAFGEEILLIDCQTFSQPVHVFQSNQDEINQIVLDAKEDFLATGDDACDIKIFGLRDRKVFKSLRYKHTNICSTVVFRKGRPWEVISGGLDCRVVHWDFSKPKCLNQFNMQELHGTPGEPTFLTPPLVHHINVSPGGSAFACALENGQIPILDAKHKNLQPKFAFYGHTQGVSQVHFLSDTRLLSAGNDSCIVEWDLEKSELYNPGEVYMNGDSSSDSNPQEEKNLAITELCKVHSTSHSCKVNWMVPRCTEGTKCVYIADQTPDVCVLNLQ